MEWQKLDEGWNDIGIFPRFISRKNENSLSVIFFHGPASWIQQGPFKSFDEPSIFTRFGRVSRARTRTREENEWLLGIYQVGTRVPGMERFIRQTGTILFRIRRTGLLPFLSFLFFSLSLLLPPWTMESEIRERRETLLAFPLLSSLFFRNVDKIAVVCYFNQLLLLN